MRYVCPATLVAFSILAPAAMFGQLTISNYQLVSQQVVSLTTANYTYTAQVNNTGAALGSVTATVSSLDPFTVRIQPNAGTLTFGPVAANGHATSTNTFTILVNRTASPAFTWADLQWTFQTTASAPVANAGPNQSATLHQTVTLDGSASTNPSNVGTLTYQWAFTSRPAGSSTVLANQTGIHPTFTVDVAGIYMIQLTVSNGTASSTANVMVTTTNIMPVANAGPNQTVAQGATVTLNGSGSSDSNGNPMTFQWTLTSVPSGSTAALNAPNSVFPTFVADKAGVYTAQLMVNDGMLNSNPATVTISTLNSPPVANAGSNQVVSIGATVQLDGSGSTDVNSDPLTYQWSLIALPTNSKAILSSTTAVKPTFVADLPGTYIAQLIVHDGSLSSAAVTVTITTNAVLAPTANAGPNQSVVQDSTVQLSGGGTDPQAYQLTYLWSFTSRPPNSTATLTGATTATPTFFADQPGTFTVQLVVNDGFLSSNAALSGSTVTISTSDLPPTANAGANQSVAVGSTVTLNGTASVDLNGDSLTYSWSFNSKPNGSSASLTGPTTVSPTFVPDVAGVYVAQLIVTDSYGTVSNPGSTVTITATQTPATITASSGTPQTAATFTAFTLPLVATVKDATNHPIQGVQVTFTAPGSGASGTFSNSSTSIQVTTDVNGNATAPFTANGTASATAYTVTANVSPALGTAASFTLTNSQATAASISVTSGSPQSAQILAAFGAPLVATVLDATSHPVPNVTVTFMAPGTGASGTFTGGVITATTNASGIATSAVFTANSTVGGPYLVTATVSGVNTPASFSLTNTAQTPASISATSGSNQSAQVLAAFSAPLVATVLDANSHPVPNVTVTFMAPASGASGTFTGGVITATTNESGVATSAVFTANSTAGGPYLVTATVSGVNTPASFSLTNTAQVPASISMTSGSNQSAQILAAFSAPLVATVLDANSHPVPNVTVTFTAPASGASGTFTGGVVTATTNSSGIATSAVFTANSTVGGPYMVNATVSGVNTPASFSLTNTVQVPASVSVTSGSNQSAQILAAFSSPLVATVLDAASHPVPNVTVTFMAPASGASGAFTGGVVTATTNASGVATSAVFTANSTVGGPYLVTATVSGVNTPASFSLTNIAQVPATISMTSGSPQSANVNLAFSAPLVATVLDAASHPVPNVVVTFTAPVTGTSGSFAGGVNTATTNASGVATSAVFTANSTVGGPYNVTANVSPALATPASFTLTNSPAAAASIVATSGTPQSVTNGSAFAPFVVTVKDASGNGVSGVTVTFAAPLSGPSGTFAGSLNTAVTNASGVATSAIFTANTTVGAQYTVAATVSGVATPANFLLTNTVGAAASITATSGTPQSVTNGTAFAPFVVTVKDSNGNPVGAGTVVSFTAPTGSVPTGTFAGGANTATTNASGVATSAIFTANTIAGAQYTVSASATGVTTPASFLLTNTPGNPASIAITSGSPQSAAEGTQFASLVATVKDSNGNVVGAGVNVTFTAPALTGASGTFANSTITTSVTTNASGVATATAFTANGILGGPYNVAATVSGVATPANFALTNTVGIAASISATSGSGQTATITSAFTSPLVATVKDSGGNPVPNIVVTFTAPSSGASGTFANTTLTTTATTNSSGLATSSTFTANATAGTFSVSATAPGVSTPATFSMTTGAGLVLQTGMQVSVGSSQSLNVSLSTAPSSSVIVTLTSASPSIVTLGPNGQTSISLSIPAGSTTPSAMPKVNGVAFGSAVITAVATGYPNATTTVVATDTISFSPTTVTISGDSTVQAASYILLSSTAPTGGITLNLSSSNTAVATVPSTVTIVSGATNVNVPVTGVSGGTATITASNASLNIAAATLGVTVNAAQITTTTLNTGLLGAPYSQQLTASGGSGTYSWLITSGSLPTGMSLSTGGLLSGAPSVTTPQAGTSLTFKVTDTSSPAQTATATLTLLVVVGTPATITATSGVTQSATDTTAFSAPLVVTVKDVNNFLVPNATVTFTAPSSGASGTFAGGGITATATTNSSGIATSPVFTADSTLGSYTVNATVSPVATSAAFNMTNTIGAASTIAVTSGTPQNTAEGTNFANPLVVTVKDVGGNVISGATVTYTIVPNGSATGTFAGGMNTAVTNVSGIATSAQFTAGGTAGTYTVTAASGAATGATFTLTNNVGGAASITVTSGNNQSAAAGSPTGAVFPNLVATVKDSGGNPVPGVTVTFAGPAQTLPGVTFGTNPVTTDSNGNATVTATANTHAGPSYTVTATATGVATPASFTLTNTAGAAASIAVSSGSNQSVADGTAFASLVAIVKDSGGNPVNNATVTFTIGTASGATASFSGANTAVTNASGLATSPGTLTANNVVGGPFTVTAAVSGVSPSASFLLTNAVGTATTITMSSGSPQSAPISTAFGTPLVAKVVDQGGNVVSGATVTFQAPASGASGTFLNGTTTTTATTGSNGLATASTFTANGTANNPSTTPYVVTATATGVATPANFSLTNLVGSAASMAVNSGSGQGAGVGVVFTNGLSVIVKDSGGNPVSGVTVTFTSPQSPNAGATFVSGSNVTTATTGANGIATSVAPTANTVEGSYNVTATANPSLSATFSLTNNAGPPASITPVAATNNQTTTVGTAYSPLQVTVKDGDGNPAPGITVTFLAVANGSVSGTFSGNASTTALTNSSGVASATLTANTKAGTFTVTASVASPALSTSFNMTSTPGTASIVTATSGTGQNVAINTNFTNSLVATVTDSNGNPISGVSVTFAAPAGSVPSATFSPSATVTTGAAGTATVTAKSNSFASTTAYSVTATATGIATPASFSLTNNAGPAANIAITSGNNQSVGIGTAYAALSVTVTDSGSNPVSGAVVTFTPATVGGATATFAGGANTATTNALGVATTTAVLTANNTKGAFTIGANTGSATLATPFAETNISGPPALITLTAPTTMTAPINTAFGSMVATLTDSGGNPVAAGVTVTFTASTVNNATGTFTTGATASVTTNASGVATAPAFTAGSVTGAYTVTVASTTGTATSKTFSMTNTPGTPATFTIGTGNNQSAVVGAAYTTAMTVTVKDAGGNLVADGTSVTFTAPTAGTGIATGTFSGAAFISKNTVSGVATVPASSLTAGTVAGPFNVAVTASTGNATTVNFAMTNLAGSASSIVATSGTPQSAQIAVQFTNPLVVTVKDANGNPVSGQTVTFTAPSPQTVPSGTFASGANTATTNASGIATSAAFTANTVVSPNGTPYTVNATVTGVSSPAAFSLSNLSGAPASITKTSGDAQSAMVGNPGNAFANPMVVTVKDAGGNPVSGASVTFTSPASTGASGTFAGTAAATVTTNSSGVATAPAYTTNTHTGANAVAVSVSTGTGSATFNLTNTPGPAATVQATSGTPQNVTISSIFPSPLVATVVDAFGNPIGAGTTVTFSVLSVPAGGQSATSQSIATNSSGVASATLTSNNKIGAYYVTAAAQGATSATYSITNTQGNPASIAIFSGSGQTAQVGAAYTNPLIVVVKDSGGNLVTGANVVFSVTSNPAGGTFSSNPAAANASGQAQTTFTANASTGTVTVQAAIGSLNLGSNTFSLTNTAGAPATITNNGFVAESIHTGVQFPNPLTALVKDASGNPVSGATVIFTSQAGSAKPVFSDNPTGNTSTAVTNSNGIATSYPVTAGSIPGTYTVTANTYPTAVTTAASYMLTNSGSGSSLGTITMTAAPGANLTVGQNMMIEVQLNLPSSPTSPLTVTATADGVNLMLGQNTPVQTEQIGFSAGGAASVLIYVQALSNVGTGTITFDAPGYTSYTGTITIAKSGFILSADGSVPPDVTTLTTYDNVTTTLSVYAVQLDSNNNFVAVGQLRGGFTASVPIAMAPANTTIGSVTSPITITGGNCCGTVNFVASSSMTGAASIALGQATGFSLPAQYVNLPVTVGAASIAPQNVTVGNYLESGVQFVLDGQAVCGTGQSYVTFTVTSNNYPKLSLSNLSGTAGASSIQVPVVCGGSLSQPFYVQVVGATVGQVLTYGVSGNSFASASGNVTVGPSGFVLGTNGGSPISGNFFYSTVTGPAESISVYSYLLDGSAQENPVTAQLVAPGVSGNASFTVGITSSNPSYGTVAPATVAITGGNYTNSVVFTPVAGGTSVSPNITNVAVTTVPSGFTAASSNYSSIAAKVTSPSFGINDGVEVGQYLQTNGTVSIGVAQTSDVYIQLTVSGNIALSATGTDAGTSTLQLKIPAGSTSVNYSIYGLGYNGTATYTVSYVSGGSGVQYTPRSSTITLEPSGVAIVGNYNQSLFTSVSNNQATYQQPPFTVEVGILNGDGSFFTQQALMGMASATANLSVNGAGTLGPAPGSTSLQVTIPTGTASIQVPYTPPTTVGTSPSISLGQVTGVTTASTQNAITVILEP